MTAKRVPDNNKICNGKIYNSIVQCALCPYEFFQYIAFLLECIGYQCNLHCIESTRQMTTTTSTYCCSYRQYRSLYRSALDRLAFFLSLSFSRSFPPHSMTISLPRSQLNGKGFVAVISCVTHFCIRQIITVLEPPAFTKQAGRHFPISARLQSLYCDAERFHQNNEYEAGFYKSTGHFFAPSVGALYMIRQQILSKMSLFRVYVMRVPSMVSLVGLDFFCVCVFFRSARSR